MNLLEYFGGTRAAVTIGCGIATTFLCFTGKITGEVYATVTIATVGAFIAGHAVDSFRGAGTNAQN